MLRSKVQITTTSMILSKELDRGGTNVLEYVPDLDDDW
jgi:hypothetical protein